MLFPASVLKQMQGLSDASLGHTCTLTDDAGAVYSGSAHVHADEVSIARALRNDSAFDADALVRLPHQSRTGWSRKVFNQDRATVECSYEGITQVGRVKSVMRRQTMCFLAVEWQDAAELETTLGTISDLVAVAGGSGAVSLAFTPVANATAYQAQQDGVNVGSPVGADIGYIALSGVTPGTYDYTVVASDATSETTSNEVELTVT